MFGKKFCAASLSFLALSFNCAHKTNAAVSGVGVFNITAGSLECVVGATSAILGVLCLNLHEDQDICEDQDKAQVENVKFMGKFLLGSGCAFIIPGIANILSGVSANDTKQNAIDIEKLNEKLEKMIEKSAK